MGPLRIFISAYPSGNYSDPPAGFRRDELLVICDWPNRVKAGLSVEKQALVSLYKNRYGISLKNCEYAEENLLDEGTRVLLDVLSQFVRL